MRQKIDHAQFRTFTYITRMPERRRMRHIRVCGENFVPRIKASSVPFWIMNSEETQGVIASCGIFKRRTTELEFRLFDSFDR